MLGLRLRFTAPPGYQLVDLHCHIQLWGSQGFSERRLRQVLARAAACGLNVLAVTEHLTARSFWEIWNALVRWDWSYAGLRVWSGTEVTVAEGADIVLLGSPEAVLRLGQRLASAQGAPSLVDLLAAAADLSLLTIGAHPYRGAAVLPTFDPRLLARLTALELNGREPRHHTRVAALAERLGLPLVAGSDAHYLWGLGRAATEVPEGVQEPADLLPLRGDRVRPLFPTFNRNFRRAQPPSYTSVLS